MSINISCSSSRVKDIYPVSRTTSLCRGRQNRLLWRVLSPSSLISRDRLYVWSNRSLYAKKDVRPSPHFMATIAKSQSLNLCFQRSSKRSCEICSGCEGGVVNWINRCGTVSCMCRPFLRLNDREIKTDPSVSSGTKKKQFRNSDADAAYPSLVLPSPCRRI
jgi:hypothetical protein